MRIFVFILALLGGIACGFLGLIAKTAESKTQAKVYLQALEQMTSEQEWEAKLRKENKNPDNVREAIARYRRLLLLCYALLAAFPLSVGAGLLILNRRGLFAAPLLLLAAAVPFYLTRQVAAHADDVPVVIQIATGLVALAGLLSLLVRRRPRAEEGLETEETRDVPAEPRPRPQPRKAASPAITPAPTPPPSLVRYPCPKCGTVLKVPMAQTHKAIRCPQCKTTAPVPAQVLEQAITASQPPPAEEPVVELLDDTPKPRPKKPSGQRKSSPVAVALATLLLLG
ncbi:MAG TPA: hypothetical protein VKD72_34945, partial [Gemmataceae bacterium]|nr:hypothetical protein [Gemmataceae bacterium]